MLQQVLGDKFATGLLPAEMGDGVVKGGKTAEVGGFAEGDWARHGDGRQVIVISIKIVIVIWTQRG